MNISQCHEKKNVQEKDLFFPIAECPRTQVYAISAVQFLFIRHGKHDLNNYNARVYMNRGYGFRVCEPGFFPPYTRPIELYNNRYEIQKFNQHFIFSLKPSGHCILLFTKNNSNLCFFSINYHRYMIVTYYNDVM